MRQLLFLLPGTTQKFHCGGLWAELKIFELAKQLCPATVVTYRQREPEYPYLPDLLQAGDPDPGIFVASWGFDVPKLVRQLTNYPVIYHAHSSEYGFRLPARIPIVCVSRNTMGYWGQRSPHSLIYYLPNQISDEFQWPAAGASAAREIDVLVHARKSSRYLMQTLVPALKHHCRVEVIDGFVASLAERFQQSRVYLYDSAEYWATQGVTEGFGLQPLEAIACGCEVFSSINHGLSDYLDPGFNCHKIAGYSAAFDRQRILAVAQGHPTRQLPPGFPDRLLQEYRTDNIRQRLYSILTELNQFFDYRLAPENQQDRGIPELNARAIAQLRAQRLWGSLQKRLKR
jgi:hypothetical protein